jgi:hypothetical protein
LFEEAVHQVQTRQISPKYAVTPIILSGLLQQQISGTAPGDNALEGTALVNHARVLRVQALQKIQNRQRDRLLQRMALGFAILLSVVAYIAYTLAALSSSIHALGHNGGIHNLTSCEDWPSVMLMLGDCSELNAKVWTFFRDYPLELGPAYKCVQNDCPVEIQANILNRLHQIPTLRGAPYTTHEVLSGDAGRHVRTMDWRPNSVQWLGQSFLMELITKHIYDNDTHIMDIECGMGGLLYALSSAPRNYTGLSSSPAEIVAARYLADFHELEKYHLGVRFRQVPEIPKMRREYNVIVSIEGMNRQPNGPSETLKSLSKSMYPGSKLIIVEDVMTYHIPELSLRYMTLTNWTYMLRYYGFELIEARDLGLEFGLPAVESRVWTRSPVILQNAFEFWMHHGIFYRNTSRLFWNVLQHMAESRARAEAFQKTEIIYTLFVARRTGTRVMFKKQ